MFRMASQINVLVKKKKDHDIKDTFARFFIICEGVMYTNSF